MGASESARAVPAPHRALVRSALVGTGLAAAWVVVSLVMSPSSASAGEPDGLLGGVGTIVGVVDDTLADVADAVVAPIAGSVADASEPAEAPVSEVVADLGEVAPDSAEPAVDAVPGILDTTVEVSGGTLDAADEAAVDTVTRLAGTLSGLSASGPAGSILDPVVDSLDEVVDGVPVLDPLVGDDTLGGILGPVTDLVDDALDTVIGDLGPLPGDGILPSLPGVDVLPGLPRSDGSPGPVPTPRAPDPISATPPNTGDHGPPGAAKVETDAGAPGSVDPLGAVGAPAAPAGPPAPYAPLGAPVTGSAGTSGAAGSAGPASDAAAAALELDALASLVLGSVDDALPSSPVYDTDTTPD